MLHMICLSGKCKLKMRYYYTPIKMAKIWNTGTAGTFISGGNANGTITLEDIW